MGSALDTIPLEVLERIALFVGWEQLSGPPKDLASLCLTCKVIHDSLSFSCNPSLYASIFRYKFDIAAPLRRLSSEYTTAQCLAGELRARFQAMQRLQRGIGSHASHSETANRKSDLWTAIIMMLEDDGKNAVQLKAFGKVQEWLHTYFLKRSGGSYIQFDMEVRNWPRDNADNSLALWLLYLLDSDGASPPCKLYTQILRAYAIGANRYPITHQSWTQFSASDFTPPLGTAHCHFNRQFYLTPPASGIAAVLGYMARVRQPTAMMWAIAADIPPAFFRPPPRGEPWDSGLVIGSSSRRWDCAWERCIGPSLGASHVDPANGLSRYYRPGSLEGSWEGLFTYAEFGVYAAMLSGEPPQVFTETTIGLNLQVWKVREYSLYSSTASASPSDGPVLPAGNPQNAFFPASTLEVDEHHAVFNYSSQRTVYHRYSQAMDGKNPSSQGVLRDVIIIGEGHSAWGDFKLRGRVRPSDAFVTILKEYNGPEDRGRWLYRGYLIGDKYVGRWRDVLTPVNMVGYEGGFELTQRGLLSSV